MMISRILGASAVAALCIGSVVAATAAEVELYHDKHFWSEQFQAVGDLAGEKTGVRIVEHAYSPPDQYKAFIQSSIASGNTPDLFTWWTGKTFEDLVATGQVATVDDVWEKMIASGAYTEDTAAPFRVDGKLYAVPLHINGWVVLYNTKMFKDAGIEEPKTWDELIAAADKLKAAGITPFVATTQDGWRGFIWFEEIMIRTNPQAYLGLHDGTVPYDGPEVRKVFEIWADMYAKGYFSDPRSNEEVQDFARGKGAMNLIGDWAVGLVKNAGMKVGDDFSAFIMPNVDPAAPSAIISEAGPLVVSVAGKEKPDVMTALDFWISEDGATKWGAVSDNSVGNHKATPPNAIVSKIGAEMADKKTVAYLRWWESVPADIQSELVAEMNSFMLDPTMENAEGIMERMQAVNKQYWDSR